LAARERTGGRRPGVYLHVVNIGKALGAQQLLCEIGGCDADARTLRDPDRRGFEPPVLSLRLRKADEAGGARRRERGKELAPILRCLHEGVLPSGSRECTARGRATM